VGYTIRPGFESEACDTVRGFRSLPLPFFTGFSELLAFRSSINFAVFPRITRAHEGMSEFMIVRRFRIRAVTKPRMLLGVKRVRTSLEEPRGDLADLAFTVHKYRSQSQ